MPSLTLVVMAAGIGSRYGGLKQLDPFGPSGEAVLEYSVYDALRAGFDKVVFIIRKDFEAQFRQAVGRKVERVAETAYVFQSIDQVPQGFSVPVGRVKPWGTGQAILVCKDVVATPFSAINADDFYGRATFEIMAGHLGRKRTNEAMSDYAMVGYRLANTLSEHGHVARGVCQATSDGYLVDIHEYLKIQRFADGVKYTENGKDWMPLPESSLVSMNFWGFAPDLFAQLDSRFRDFLREDTGNLTKAEYLIPEVVGSLVRERKARVTILPTQDRWFGVTYPEDRPIVQAAILERVRQGIYPADLWSGA
jgi:hypothetical protein